MPDLPTRSGGNSRSFWSPDLLIRTDIFIRIRKEYTPGGHTGSRPAKRMQDGALIISVCQKLGRQTGERHDSHRNHGFGSLSCGAGDTVGFTVSRRERGRSTRGLGFKALLKSAVARTINTENYGKLNGQEADDYEFTYYRTFDQIVYGASSFR